MKIDLSHLYMYKVKYYAYSVEANNGKVQMLLSMSWYILKQTNLILFILEMTILIKLLEI